MELIERYLNEVGRRLPKEKREDICEELRSAIDDAIEDRSFGQPGEDDVAAVLESFGSPQQVAASYSGDRYLVGPELYPQFVTTLKITATVFIALAALGSALAAISSPSFLDNLGASMARLVNGVIDSFITALGIVVVVFALLERLDLKIELGGKKAKAWNPRDLPAVRDADIVGRFESIAGVVFPAIVLVLINQFSDRIGIWVFSDSGRSAIGIAAGEDGVLLLNDVFVQNLPWINVSLILPMLLSVWLFWSGRWSLPTRLLRISFDVFGVYVLYLICEDLIDAQSQLQAADVPQVLVNLVLRGAEIAPYLVGAAVLLGAVSHLVKALRR
jgi:hypothetical protein